MDILHGEGNMSNTSCDCDDDVNTVRSPMEKMAKNITIPDISLPEFLFQAIDINYDAWKNRIWVTDVGSGTSYKFCDIKPVARKIASALTRLGFRKGDVLFCVTNEAALIYLVNIGVWLCGGAVRGCYDGEREEVFIAQMKEVSTRFVLCDPETAAPVKRAVGKLDWNVNILSISGEVEGAASIEEMIKEEDCSAFPKDVKIDPKEDAAVIINTSGSTGTPKGVIQTHYTYVSYLKLRGLRDKTSTEEGKTETSLMAAVGNFFASLYAVSCFTITKGSLFYNSSKCDQNSFVKNLLKYKPESVFLHPYALHAFLQHPEIEHTDMSFLKIIHCSGSVLNYATARALGAKLPHVFLLSAYGISETLLIAASHLHVPSAAKNTSGDDRVAGAKFNTLDGENYMSSGFLEPVVIAKIVDTTTGRSLGRNKKGKLLVKTKHMMKGYISDCEKKDSCSFVDENGWYDTGDIAYFDEEDYLYVVDRDKFTFKCHAHWVSPSEVEAIILKHPAVVSAVVVGVPDPEKTSIAKAYVVLKPGCKVTKEDIQAHVAETAEDYKHLYGGVTFVEGLPVTAGGKLDRPALLKRAIAELSSSS